MIVVDDDALLRALLSEAMREAGISVVEAASADEAWAFLEAGGEVDLVFSDVRMPGTLNGLELARRVREKQPSLPLILASADEDAFRQETPGSFIPKPYDIFKVIAAVLETLGSEPRAEIDERCRHSGSRA